ncbi:MAG: serine/threonine-protein kinase [Cyanobacteria bacterium P01_F01_bin.150]
MALNFLRSLQLRSKPPLGGHYKIIQELGAGGFGHTFLAQDLHLPGQPTCVIKQLKPHVESAQALQVARRLFDTEAKVLYALGTHPQIPQLLAHFEDKNEFYLAQELIEGHSLSEEFTTTKRWTDSQVVTFLGDVLGTLSVVHQQRVIHRDLKPSNLMRRRRDQRIVLIDFGAVKQASTQLINSETSISHTISIGTQGYMPNEQIVGMPQFSSDLYAVGVMGIQLLTRRHPRMLTPDPTTGELNWHDYAEQVRPELVAFLDKMVRYDFRSRYAIAADAFNALKKLPEELVQAIPASLSNPVQNDQAKDHADSQQAGHTSVSLQASAKEQSTESTLVVAPSFPTQDSSVDSSMPHEGISSSIPSMELARTQRVVGQRMDISKEHSHNGHGISHRMTKTTGTTELVTNPQPFIHTRSPLGPYRRVFPAAIAVLGALIIGVILGKSGLEPSPLSPTIAQTNSSASETAGHIPGSEAATDDQSSTPTHQAEPQPSSSSFPSIDGPSPSAYLNQTQPSSSSNPIEGSTVITPPSHIDNAISPLTAQLTQAVQLQDAGQYSEALVLYERAIAAYPDATEAYVGQCYSLNALQRFDEAIAACDQAIDLDKDHSRALWSKGYALEQQQEYKDAIKLYDKAIKKDPAFAEAWNNKGTALLRMDKLQKAVDAFDEAIALDPSLSEAWSNRGAALWGLQQFSAALDSVDRALSLEPENADAMQLAQTMREILND